MDTHAFDPHPAGTRAASPQPYIPGERVQPTTIAHMDQAIALLQSHKDNWARSTVPDRIRLLDAVINAYVPLCETWVERGLRAKGASQDAYAAGWEWSSGPMPILRLLRGLRRTLVAVAHAGHPPLPGPLVTRANGQVSARIYPTNLYERLSTPGTTAEIWMEPGLSADQVRHSQASAYTLSEQTAQLCLVLGAGNIAGIPVNDSLTKLFIENQVVLLKMNPVNDYLGSLIETTFAPLIAEGYLRVVYGGAAEGAYLCHHPSIDCIHMTGSSQTYETIVFGPGAEGRQRQRERRSLCDKPFTAELGNIAPCIVVPGPWSQQDVTYQAEQLASHLCDSASFSCSRTRLIVQHAGWEHRHDLLREIKAVLARVPPRADYYPGAAEQHRRFVSAHPHAQPCGAEKEGTLPWTLITDLNPHSQDEICFAQESFCPILAETALEASSTADLVTRAVEFANQRLWGTLTASLIIHPQSLRDPKVHSAVEQALEQLRYGVVAINCLPGLAWGIVSPPWGSFPGNTPWDIQSGTGFIHNSYMFAHPQKTVLRGPFRTWPRPPWFPSRASRMGEICRKVAMYEAEPSARRMFDTILAALR
jgi:acyl-CoA reductase-like NAD-dependent aldehyde dehydrogenase